MFAELEVTQCTGWMHCFVGGWIAAHFYTAISANRAMFNNAVTCVIAPQKGKWRTLWRDAVIELQHGLSRTYPPAVPVISLRLHLLLCIPWIVCCQPERSPCHKLN